MSVVPEEMQYGHLRGTVIHVGISVYISMETALLSLMGNLCLGGRRHQPACTGSQLAIVGHLTHGRQQGDISWGTSM